MEVLERMPFEKKNFIFAKLAEIAEVRKLKPEEKIAYRASLKHYRDSYSVIKTAKEEGRAEGRAEGIEKGIEKGEHNKAIAVAQNLKQMGLSTTDIQKVTGLSLDDIEHL